ASAGATVSTSTTSVWVAASTALTFMPCPKSAPFGISTCTLPLFSIVSFTGTGRPTCRNEPSVASVTTTSPSGGAPSPAEPDEASAPNAASAAAAANGERKDTTRLVFRPPRSALHLVAVPLVEAAARLAAELPLLHHLLQQLGGLERGLVRVALVPAFQDRQRRVEADVIQQLDRPHRMAAAELHAGVDVLERRVAALDHQDRLVEQRHEQPVHHEA